MIREKISVKNLIKAAWLLYAVVSILIWLPSIDRMLTYDFAQVDSYISLDDSWEVAINGETYLDVSLGDFRFPAVKMGDRITMSRELPQDWEMGEGVLRISVRHCAVRVYVGEEMVFEYGYDRLARNKTVGSGYQFINFPKDYRGKTLRIDFYVSENKVFSKLDSVRIYEWQNAYRVLMTENRLPWFFGSFLSVFGLAGCIMTIFALVVSRKYLRLLCISCFSICMGLWTLCYYRVIAIYAIPLYFVSLLEHVALYLAPLPLILYMHDDVMRLKQKAFHIIYRVILYGDIAALAISMVLHAKDIVHLAAILPYMIVFMVVCLVYFFVVIVMNLKRDRTVNRLYLVGMLIIVCCVGYDLIGYNRERYSGNDSMMAVKGMSAIGFMIFIFILILTFYMDLTKKMMREAERNSLIKSAYTDELTKLHNRRYCMEHMNRLQEQRISDYTIICFDLNNLKTVNDTYGHAKGDVLICAAADVLEETFGEYGVVARMGGDEFICVLDSADGQKTAALFEKMKENIGRKKRLMGDLDISIACGFASGRENHEDIERVYQLADDRMYENKKQMKEKARKALSDS